MIDYFGPAIFDSPKIYNVPFVWWFTILQELARHTGFSLIVTFAIEMVICFVLRRFGCQSLSFEDNFYFDKKKEPPDKNQIKRKSIWNNFIGILISMSLGNPVNSFVIMGEKGYGFQPGNFKINHLLSNPITILRENQKYTQQLDQFPSNHLANPGRRSHPRGGRCFEHRHPSHHPAVPAGREPLTRSGTSG